MSVSLLLIVGVLMALAGFDLWVGVTNDAVNFMNSAFGAKAAKRRTILLIAVIGVAAGALLSGGMMEVARKGIFDPGFFTANDGVIDVSAVLMIYLGVMAADVIMLDVFNTFGFPTSTTVSIVSELAGASLAVAFWSHGRNIQAAWGVLHPGPMGTIYLGIFLSILLAFGAGAVAMFLVRLAFGHDLARSFARYGWLWAGVSMSSVIYFVLFKGLKHAAFLTASVKASIQGSLWLILGAVFIVTAGITYANRHRHEHVLRVLILAGTASLAMAFAGNDLVNFIGPAVAGATAVFASGASLTGHVPTPVWALGIAGLAMGVALFRSRKTATVSDAELRIASQHEEQQRFSVPAPVRAVVAMASHAQSGLSGLLPRHTRKWISERLNPSSSPETKNAPPYDLLRSSVNLSVATVLISIGTANKLPLSTTYITFMVAMGASLADGSWRRGQAGARLTGMLAVVAGWLLTGVLAATGAMATASIGYLLGPTAGPLVLSALVLISIKRMALVHRHRTASRPSLSGIALPEVPKRAAVINASA